MSADDPRLSGARDRMRAIEAAVIEDWSEDRRPAAVRNADRRPEILLRPELNKMTEEVLDAVAERPDLGVYVRGRMLVEVAWDGRSKLERWLRRPSGAPTIVPIEHARMRSIMDAAARFIRPDGRRRDKLVPATPPSDLSAQVLARLDWPLPYLDAVVETPTIREDGSILDAPGYDQQTGLLYEPIPGSGVWPGVAASPSKAEVRHAVADLLEAVADFPFVSATDRSAYLAAVLTLIARHLIDGPVPAFVVRAPAPGTGKTLLVVVAVLVGTGRAPAVMAFSHDGDELRKRVTSIALSGTSVVLIDNVSGSFGGDVLAGALTATTWEDRLLGRSEMVRLPLRTTWFVTGNNVAFKKTLARRVIPIDLDAQCEVPEDRTGFHIKDLEAHVRANRLRLVASALTILRGFLAAGRPLHSRPRLGSFEDWDDLVRSAVVWAGLDDPAAADDPTRGRGRIRAEADDDADRLSTLLGALRDAFPPDADFSAAEALAQAEKQDDLRAALDAVAPDRGSSRATVRSLGYGFREAESRPYDGRRLVRVPGKRPARYRIERT